MSAASAGYAFFPWLRRGIASEITRTDGTLTGAAREEMPVTLQLKAGGATHDLLVNVALFGPGEIGGIDPRIVIRTNPMPGEFDAAADRFPAAEFDQPDFPWRYTPARADNHARLRPWLVLAVVTLDEIVSEAAADGDGKLAEITVADAAALPRLGQSWAWSHVQVDGFDPAAETLQTVAGESPARLRSRIVAPRRLLPRTRYRAFLVPSFERGRRAGLREPIDESIDGLLPAWAENDSEVRLPVYFAWDFQTGDRGDFESLARRLTPRSAAGAIGVRDMDASTPDAALPPAAADPMGVAGALISPGANPAPWPSPEREAFQTVLAALLNRPAELLATTGEERRVAPPLWGQWHAARSRLATEEGASPPWFHQLNSDPRLRVAAGLGAEVVRRNDQQLMAEAWKQVEGVLEANAELKRAQLARAASEKLQRKHLLPLAAELFLEVTAPLHARFKIDLVTIREVLRRSPVPVGACDGQFRRIFRSRGPTGRRLGRLRSSRFKPLLHRLNSGEVRARPQVSAPEGMVTLSRIGVPLAPASGHPKPSQGYVPAITLPGAKLPQPPRKGEIGETDRKLAGAQFHEALSDLIRVIETRPRPGPKRVAADLASLRDRLVERMDPRITIPAGIRERLSLADWVKWDYEDPLEPIMVAPYFDNPMYEPLRDLSQSWLLPGAGRIPPDTATLVLANQPFIEGYMAGLNHEMARELLYHEYPTDQRGTHFRQFWDVRGALGNGVAGPDPEALRDIKPIHLWTEMLGDHSGRIPVPREGHVVLVIKGEMFRRYPNTQVYAVETVLDGTGQRNLGTVPKFPIFEGRLDPDISFFGFDLLPEEARGSAAGGNHGWYFLLQEQPTEPTFGLDKSTGNFGAQPTAWSDLSWAHLAPDQAALDGLGYIDLNADRPYTNGITPASDEPPLAWHADQGQGASGANASDLAYITLQRPVRVAIHASEMLPPPNLPP